MPRKTSSSTMGATIAPRIRNVTIASSVVARAHSSEKFEWSPMCRASAGSPPMIHHQRAKRAVVANATARFKPLTATPLAGLQGVDYALHDMRGEVDQAVVGIRDTVDDADDIGARAVSAGDLVNLFLRETRCVLGAFGIAHDAFLFVTGWNSWD